MLFLSVAINIPLPSLLESVGCLWFRYRLCNLEINNGYLKGKNSSDRNPNLLPDPQGQVPAIGEECQLSQYYLGDLQLPAVGETQAL